MKAITKKLKRLVDKKLEETLLEGEHEELLQLLSQSHEARVYAAQMETMHQSLQEAGKEKVMVDMSEAIMDSVKSATPTRKEAKVIRLSMHMLAYNKQILKYAAILVAGLLLGSAATFMLLHGTAGNGHDNMSATISGRSLQPVSYKEDALQLQIQPVVSTDKVVLMVNLRSASPVVLTLRYDQQVFRLESTRFLSYDYAPEASSLSGQFQLQSDGDQVFHLLFNRHPGMPSPLVMEVVQNGTPIYQKEIFIP